MMRVHQLLKNDKKKRKKTISETVIENEDVNDHDDNESIFLGKK